MWFVIDPKWVLKVVKSANAPIQMQKLVRLQWTKFCLAAKLLEDTNKGNWMTMLIHFFCLCPLGLTIKLNFNIAKMAYSRRSPNCKKGKIFSTNTRVSKSEKIFGQHNLLWRKHFPCITCTEDTNTKLGLRSPMPVRTLGTRLAFSYVRRQLNCVYLSS